MGSGVRIEANQDNGVRVAPSFAAAFDHFTDGVLVAELLAPEAGRRGGAYRVVYVNAAFTALSGWTADAVLGHGAPAMRAAGTLTAEEQRVHQALVRGEPVEAKLPLLRRDGSRYIAHLRVSPVHDAAGARYLVSFFHEVEPDVASYRALVETTTTAVVVVDPAGVVRWQSRPATRLLGVLRGLPFVDIVHSDDRRPVISALATAAALPGARPPNEARLAVARGDRTYRSMELVLVNLVDDPAIEGVAIWVRDIHDYRRAVSLLQRQRTVLEQIVAGSDATAALLAIVRMVEAHTPGAMCSVMRLDSVTSRIVHVVGPALPAAYQAAMSAGAPIGPRAGACGTAAFLGEPIVSEDIGTDPLWEDYRAIARRAGLAACWSAPIVSGRDGRVLGTFAMYFGAPRQPGSLDWELLRVATRLAAPAMEHAPPEAC